MCKYFKKLSDGLDGMGEEWNLFFGEFSENIGLLSK